MQLKNSFKPYCARENEEKTALILIVDAGCTIHKKSFSRATTILLFPISNYVLYCKEGWKHKPKAPSVFLHL